MLFNLEGCLFIHSDRIDGRGGGVALFVSNTYNFKIRKDIDLNVDGIEFLFIEIIVQSGKNIIVGIIYRQPKSRIYSFISDFDTCLQELNTENIFILKSNNKYSVDFLQVLYSSQLLPLIDKPTRLSARSATLIDNIFTNNINSFITSGIFYNNVTNHLPIFQITNHAISNMPVQNVKKRLINDKTMNNWKLDLMTEDWISVIFSNDAEIAYKKFQTKFTLYYEKNLTLITKKRKNKCKKPWLNFELLKLVEGKNKLYRRYCKMRSNTNKTRL